MNEIDLIIICRLDSPPICRPPLKAKMSFYFKKTTTRNIVYVRIFQIYLE